MGNPLNWKALAVALGAFSGVTLFVSALVAMNGKEFWWFNSLTWPILAKTYGLSATVAGAGWGLVIGFVCGAICGAVIAAVYNWANKKWK